MADTQDLTDTLEDIEDWLYQDSLIDVTDAQRKGIEEALRKDLETGASLPTPDEVEVFICGEGDTGEIPIKLAQRYSNLHEYLEELF